MTRHRRTVPAMLAAGLALVLTACSAGPPEETGTDGPAPTPTPTGEEPAALTIGLTYTPDVQFAPFYVAEDAGYYADAGVDVTLRHHGASESLFGALEAGEEQVVVAGGDEMLQARAEGVPIVNVATLYQDYPVVLIVPADSEITEAADLEGRSVGIPGPYGETYFGLLALLEQAGLGVDDVDVQHIGYTQQAALTAGHVDAVMGFANNDVVQFGQAGLQVRAIALGGPAEVPLVGIGLGAAEQVLEQDRAAVQAVVEATLRGVTDVLADPEAALEITAEHVPGITGAAQQEAALATLRATAELYEAEAAELGENDPARWAQMAEFMDARGLLAGPVEPAEAVTTDLVGAAG